MEIQLNLQLSQIFIGKGNYFSTFSPKGNRFDLLKYWFRLWWFEIKIDKTSWVFRLRIWIINWLLIWCLADCQFMNLIGCLLNSNPVSSITNYKSRIITFIISNNKVIILTKKIVSFKKQTLNHNHIKVDTPKYQRINHLVMKWKI